MQKSVGLCIAALSIGCISPNLHPAAGPLTQAGTTEWVVVPRAEYHRDIAVGRHADGTAAFDRIKALAGEWTATNGKLVLTDVFRPIAYGTAVIAEEWVNGEASTATVFYVVDGELRADHFCDYENQPRYAATAMPDTNVVDFELREVTNLVGHPKHFHAMTWRFIDANHHTQEWRAVENGTETDTVRLAFTRTK